MRTDAFSLISGAGMGAGLMYFLDPDRGRRRRALMRDKSIRWSRKTREFAGSASRDVRNRATGVGAGLKSWMQPASSVPDRVLAERIRQSMVSKGQRDIYLRTDGAVQAQNILDVIDRLKEGGIEKVGIVALPKGK